MPDNAGFGTPTLGEMLANHTAMAAAPAPKEVPPDPVIPATAAEAKARLAAVKADPKWVDEYLSGSSRHAKEMRELRAVIDADQTAVDPQTEMAIAGKLFDGIQPSGHLARVGTAEMLRAAGVGDEAVIRQVLTGQAVTQQEHAAATETKARLMKDKAFVEKYMTGDDEAKRTMTLLNIVASSQIKRDAA